MTDEDVERFLWEVETHLADLPGDRRLAALKQVERDLDAVAHDHAKRDGRDDVTWHDYVQATAELGPPDELAARILGRPLRPGQSARRAFVAAGIALAVLLVAVGMALMAPNDFTPVGRWEGAEASRSGQFNASFEVAPDAEAVRLDLQFVPAPPPDRSAPGEAHVMVFDGAVTVVFEGTATIADSVQTTRMLQGQPGTWRILVDFDRYVGPWAIAAFEAR